MFPVYFYNSAARAIDESTMTCKYKNVYKTQELNCTLQPSHGLDSISILLANFINVKKIKEISNISFDFWFKLDHKLVFIIINTLVSTIILCMLFFSLLSIAERTLKQV